MKAHASGFLYILRLSIQGWIDDKASSMGAALAYYTVFSMAPLLLIVIAIGGLVFGEEAARGAVLEQIGGLIGKNGAEAVQAVLAGSRDHSGSLVSVMLGTGALIVGATSVFNELKSDLDRIWKLPPAQGGVWTVVRTRLLSFGLVVSLGFLLLVSLIVSAGISAFGHFMGQSFPGEETVLQGFNTAVSIGVITLVFALLYKLLPGAAVKWSDVWIGAAMTSVLFSLGKFLIGLYIGKAAFNSSFGAAGAFVVLLVWAYYAAQIFLFGAEFTYYRAKVVGAAAAFPGTTPKR